MTSDGGRYSAPLRSALRTGLRAGGRYSAPLRSALRAGLRAGGATPLRYVAHYERGCERGALLRCAA